jgi:ATP/maltotriose-dependent transcriptional regulator MalT/DNA-binding SARP family transcriptional activator
MQIKARRSSDLAKTTRPVVSGVVSRTRLFRILDRRRRHPVFWVTGPPGAGKTTLVASYLQARPLRALWYQVDEGDADVAAFFYYMSRAAGRATRGVRRPLPLLTPEHWPRLAAFSRRFFQELFARLPAPFVLVLDNYQEVPEHSRLHDVLADGLSGLPRGGGAIVVSRREPPPSLARLQAEGRLAVIGWEQLRLTRAESLAVARRRTPALSADIVDRLQERTEGWAAGLVLMLGQDGPSAPGPSGPGEGTPAAVFDYFASETFRAADPATREFLLKTAFLPRMTAPMAAALTGLDRADRLLAGLSARNYFTEKRAPGEAVYEYHPLFREFLQARARAVLPPPGLAAVQRRAARLLAGAGQVEDAVGLLRECGDVEGLADVVVRAAKSLIEQGRHQTFEEWVGLLPAAVVEGDPWLQYWLGTARTPFEPVRARRHLERAWSEFEARGDREGILSAWAGVVGTILYDWEDFTPLDLWIERLERLLQVAPEFPTPALETRVTATMFYALMFRQPQHPEIGAWAERAFAVSRRAGVDRRITTGFLLTTYYLWVGENARAVVALDWLRNLARAPDASPLAVLTCRAVEAYYQWHMAEPALCLQAVESGLEVARSSGVHLFDAQLAAQGAYGALVAGDLAAARQRLRALAAIVGGDRGLHASHYHYLAGWEALLRRDAPVAREHARAALRLATEAGTPYPEAWNHVAMAWVLHASGEKAEASLHLDRARRMGRELGSHMVQFMCLLAEAHVARDGEEDGRALAALREAMALGRTQGYCTIPWWRPEVMAELCARALAAGIEVEYVQGIVRAHRLVPAAPHRAPDAWPWPLRLHLLGGFSLLRDGAPIASSGKVQQKPLALLKALVASGGRDVAEEVLADALWPDAPGDAGHQAFATTLHRLRVLLGEEGAARLQEGRLSLDARYVWLDTWAFERLLDDASQADRAGRSPESARLIEEALRLYRGPFLPGDGRAEWAISLRERLRSRFLRGTAWLGRHWTAAGEWSRAVDTYERGLAVDDLAEEFYQGLMSCYLRLGRRAEALGVYERCRRILAATLQVPPSPATEAIRRTL